MHVLHVFSDVSLVLARHVACADAAMPPTTDTLGRLYSWFLLLFLLFLRQAAYSLVRVLSLDSGISGIQLRLAAYSFLLRLAVVVGSFLLRLAVVVGSLFLNIVY